MEPLVHCYLIHPQHILLLSAVQKEPSISGLGNHYHMSSEGADVTVSFLPINTSHGRTCVHGYPLSILCNCFQSPIP